ncbi:MAG: hypothetical protein ACXWJ0_07900 [Xanthobacteraceae bacterium]
MFSTPHDLNRSSRIPPFGRSRIWRRIFFVGLLSLAAAASWRELAHANPSIPDAKAHHARMVDEMRFAQNRNPGNQVTINPQPLPPKYMTGNGPVGGDPGSKVTINPQPLPPKYMTGNGPLGGDPGNKASINPQPLPPKEMVTPGLLENGPNSSSQGPSATGSPSSAPAGHAIGIVR